MLLEIYLKNRADDVIILAHLSKVCFPGLSISGL